MLTNVQLKQADDPDEVEIRRCISALVKARTSREAKPARRLLIERLGDHAVPLLVQQLNRCERHTDFNRIARTLAEIGGNAAFEALTIQARTQKRFVGYSVRALARCQHPDAIPVLVDLLQYRRLRQRKAAARGLASLRTPLAIEPLCHAVRSNSGIEDEARRSLRTIGREGGLAAKVLQEPTFTLHDQLRILDAISAARLTLRPFNVKRYLEAESRRPMSRVHSEARAALEALNNKTTLLRASAHRDDATLMRPAVAPSRIDEAELLRPWDPTEVASIEASPAERQRGAMAAFFERVSAPWLRLVGRNTR